jgi:hypothetical protein
MKKPELSLVFNGCESRSDTKGRTYVEGFWEGEVGDGCIMRSFIPCMVYQMILG